MVPSLKTSFNARLSLAGNTLTMDLHEPNVEELETSIRTKHDLRWVLLVSELIYIGK